MDKKYKKHEKHKNAQNVKRAIFFFLDVFMRIEIPSFLFHTHKKAQKAHKKHKNANKRISDFLPLRCFLSA